MLRNSFSGVGNLGGDPERKGVLIDSQERSVVQFSVYFPNPVSDGNGSYKDKGGFWANVAVWSPSLGDRVMDLLRKGTRVFVTGRLRQSTWDGQDGTVHQSLEVAADDVCLSLLGLEQVIRAKPASSRAADTAPLPIDDDIPF